MRYTCQTVSTKIQLISLDCLFRIPLYLVLTQLDPTTSHYNFLLTQKLLLPLLVTFNLCITIFHIQVIQQVDIVAAFQFIISQLVSECVVMSLLLVNLTSSTHHHKTSVHLCQLNCVKSSCKIHTQLKFIIAIVAFLAYLLFVFVLDFCNLEVSSLQSLIKFVIHLIDAILLGLLFSIFQVYLVIVIFKLFHSQPEILH